MNLHDRLEQLYASIDGPARLASDPVRFAHRYTEASDIEIAAFIASGFAFGRVAAFSPVIAAVLDRSDTAGGPAEWLRTFEIDREQDALGGVYYRWIRGADILDLLAGLRRALEAHGSLGALVQPGADETDLGPALSRMVRSLRSHIGWVGASRGLRYLLPDPASGSTAKRLNMFARWMVRPPTEGIDFGLWDHVPTRLLVMPVDTHVHRIARLVGLTERKTANWRTAIELTEALRRFDPDDPVRFDFALAHLGISGGCTARYEVKVCPGCALRQVCTVGKGSLDSDV